jgi:hypothetical protein
MTDYTPDGSTVMGLIQKWSKKPVVKVKERHECYDRVMKLLYGHHEDYEEWLTDPGMQKQMQMNIGYFIQDLIGNLKGHTNFREGHASGLDGENILNGAHILYEIKVDDRTTNSSSLQECINKLKRLQSTTALNPCSYSFSERRGLRQTVSTQSFSLTAMTISTSMFLQILVG